MQVWRGADRRSRSSSRLGGSFMDSMIPGTSPPASWQRSARPRPNLPISSSSLVRRLRAALRLSTCGHMAVEAIHALEVLPANMDAALSASVRFPGKTGITHRVIRETATFHQNRRQVGRISRSTAVRPGALTRFIAVRQGKPWPRQLAQLAAAPVTCQMSSLSVRSIDVIRQ
jgi:hypothetical protein